MGPDMDIKFHQVVMKIVSYGNSITAIFSVHAPNKEYVTLNAPEKEYDL